MRNVLAMAATLSLTVVPGLQGQEGPYHAGCQKWVADLNAVYLATPALWRGDYDHDGFWWVDCGDHANSVLSFIRHDRETGGHALVVLNLTPNPLRNYRVGLPLPGVWREVLNSDADIYGGSNQGNLGGVQAQEYNVHNQPFSAEFTLPPMSAIVFQSGQ